MPIIVECNKKSDQCAHQCSNSGCGSKQTVRGVHQRISETEAKHRHHHHRRGCPDRQTREPFEDFAPPWPWSFVRRAFCCSSSDSKFLQPLRSFHRTFFLVAARIHRAGRPGFAFLGGCHAFVEPSRADEGPAAEGAEPDPRPSLSFATRTPDKERLPLAKACAATRFYFRHTDTDGATNSLVRPHENKPFRDDRLHDRRRCRGTCFRVSHRRGVIAQRVVQVQPYRPPPRPNERLP